MKRLWSLLFVLIFSVSFLVTPHPIQAQSDTPPTPEEITPPLAGDLPEGVIQDAEGSLAVQDTFLTAQGQEPAAPQAAAGPATDKFGYKRSAVPVQWLDVKTNGTQLNIHAGQGKDTVVFADGFTFPFYDLKFTQAPVSGYGYLNMRNYPWYPSSGRIPSVSLPNAMIAPFWFPAYYHQPDSGVYYMHGVWDTGVDAGVRYTAIEWHQLQDSLDNTYTFEAILFENGNILFQYQEMLLVDRDWNCASGGIENGSGEIGLTTLRLCSWQKSSTAWKITRPKSTGRPFITKPYQGGFASAGSSLTYRVEIKNAGDLGPDTFDISVSSRWPVTLYQLDGVTPLADTDGDKKVDTGTVASNALFSLIAQVNIPAGIPVGKASTSVITARSSLTPSKTAKSTLTTAVPDHFALVFHGDHYTQIYQAAPDQQNRWSADTDQNLIERPDGAFAQTYSYLICGDYSCGTIVPRMAQAVFAQDGSRLQPDVILSEFGNDTNTSLGARQVALQPDGRSAVIFEKRETHPDDPNYLRKNLYLGIVNPNPGATLWTEVNLTGDEEYHLDTHSYDFLGVAAAPDNRFVAIWTRYAYDYETDTLQPGKVWAASVIADGQINTPATLLTPSAGTFHSSRISPLNNGMVAVQWIGYVDDQPKLGNQAYIALLDYNLFAWLPARGIAKADGGVNSQQLPNGNILMVWNRAFGDPTSTNYAVRYQYILLKPETLARASGIRTLKKPFSEESLGSNIGVTVDAAGDGILIWRGSSGQGFSDLFYTRISGQSGAVLTKTMPIAASFDSYRINSFFTSGLTTNLVP